MSITKGSVWGALKALFPIKHNKHRQTVWQCECACGKIVAILGHNLQSGRTKTCNNCSTGKILLKIIEDIIVQEPTNPIRISQQMINGLGGNKKAIKSIRRAVPGCDAIIIEETDVTIWSSQIDCKDSNGSVITVENKDSDNKLDK